MTLRQWAGTTCTLTVISLTAIGCGGGGSDTLPGIEYPSAPITGSSRADVITAPTVAPPATNASTGQTTTTITNPATGATLTDVVIPTNPALQPRTGEPVVVIPATTTSIGATIAPDSVTGAEPVVSLLPNDASEVEEDTRQAGTPLLRATMNRDGSLKQNVAVAAVGTYTLRFRNVTAVSSGSRQLTIDRLSIVFQVKRDGATYRTTLPSSFNANLPAFGEVIAPNPSLTGWQAGGIQFALDSGAAGGTAILSLTHANGTVTRTASVGSTTDSAGQVLTQILMNSGGPTMGNPCRRVDLKTFFP